MARPKGIPSDKRGLRYDLMKQGHIRIYHAWEPMKRRCNGYDELHRKYYKSINYDPLWHQFKNFYIDMYDSFIDHFVEYGSRNTTLDRIDNTKGYSKDNCRWATCKQQSRNTRRTRLVTINGETNALSYFIEKSGLKNSTVSMRIHHGWTVENALNTQKGSGYHQYMDRCQQR